MVPAALSSSRLLSSAHSYTFQKIACQSARYLSWKMTVKTNAAASSTEGPSCASAAAEGQSQAPFNCVATIVRDVIKSPEDKREYCSFELTNGLRALVVSDPKSDKAAAALNVHVGSLSDPVELQGLAHFLEHMLFLGTKTYPSENEYHRFINEHAGTFNAYTSLENTNFFFDVGPQHLAGALDRFSQFFICPLFTESATDREINAVNSENEKNLKNDGWRLLQLEKSLSDPTHPYSKFTTGNRKCLMEDPALKGINVREELLRFHEKYYSANIMSICLVGQEPINDLIRLVTERFAAVVNKEVTIPTWFDHHPLSEPYLKKMVYAVPVKDKRSMSILWPIPDYHEHYKSDPGHYLGHLLGHEAKGSLLSELKARGWVNTLMSGPSLGARGFAFYSLSVDLSESGVDHVEDIIEVVFQYINLLRAEGIQEWIFEEKKALSKMRFRFKGKESPIRLAPTLACRQRDYPMDEPLYGPYNMDTFQPALVKELLELLTPDRMKVTVIGQHLESKAARQEKWYGTRYFVEDIPEATLQRYRECGTHPNLHIPLKNEFIAENFDLKTREESPNNMPEVLIDSKLCRIWFKQDSEFLIPKVFAAFHFKNPFAYSSPHTFCMTSLLFALFNDSMTEFAYDAELADIHFDAVETSKGFKLEFNGYNDKMAPFIRHVMQSLVNLVMKQDRFDNIRDIFERELRNHATQQPIQHTVYYSSMLLAEDMWTVEEKLLALPDITLERLQHFLPQLLSHLCIEGLIYGNCSKKDAFELTDQLESILIENCKTSPVRPHHILPGRELMIPEGSHHIFQALNTCHTTSALSMYFQCNLQNVEEITLLSLLSQVLQEVTFNTLRTEQQLGYIVSSGTRRSHSVQGFRVMVQSDRRPDFLEKRVEEFLGVKARKMLEEMDAETFEKHKTALHDRLMEKPKQQQSQMSVYWNEIVLQHYFFNRNETLDEKLKTFTKERLVNFYNTMIAPGSPQRKVLSIHVISEKSHGKELPALDGDTKGQLIERAAEFRRSYPLSPLIPPFLCFPPPGPKL